MLRATTACTFSTSQLRKVARIRGVFNILAGTFSASQLRKVLRAWCVLYILLRNVLRATTASTFSFLIWPDGSAPAALASLLFDPPEPQIIGKTQCFAIFLPFRASELLSSDSFSSTLLFSLTLPASAFHLPILSEV